MTKCPFENVHFKIFFFMPVCSGQVQIRMKVQQLRVRLATFVIPIPDFDQFTVNGHLSTN